MRHPLTLAVTAVTLALTTPALAQTAAPALPATPTTPADTTTTATTATPQEATVQDVVVTGTTDLLANFLKASLSVQPGAALSSVNLRAVEQEVLATGYFKTAAAQIRPVNGQSVLALTVVTNPLIKDVTVTGLNFLPADDFKARVGELLNIAPGATLNTQRLEQAKQALLQNYQQQGFPFTPTITTQVKTNTDGTASVSFVADETAPISRIEVTGATLVPQATISDIFRPLYNAKKFTTQAFFAASDAVSKAYSDAGYLQSGIDPTNLTLEKGVLKVHIIEGKATSIDTSALQADGSTDDLSSGLLTRVGQPLTLANLQADVRTLANKTGKPVGFALQPDQQNPGQVSVAFGSAEVEGGPVKSIVFSGNTEVPTATLAAALKTKVGDVYSPQLAQDDFVAVREAYRKAGYEISTRDAIDFKDGVLTFNIREVTVVGYELAWQGKHKTKDRVILRELPPVGQRFNLNDLRDSLGRVSRLGFVTITGENVVAKDPTKPEEVTYVLQLSEVNTGIPVNLGLGYDTLTGWSGEAGYSNSNVFGLGHFFQINGGAQQNQAGQNWVGSVSYTIPWLELNFGDFKKRRTSLTLGVGSTVGGNVALLDTAKADTGRDYTVRTTGFSVNLGRNITPNLTASVGTSFNYKTYYLEPMQAGETSSTDDTAAGLLLPKTNLTTRFQGGLNYDTTDNPDFPGRGVRASATAGYNFGRSGDTPLGWTDAEIGGSVYRGFGKKTTQQYGLETYKNVLAARVNYGTNFGTYPDGTGYYIGGSNQLSSRELRGLNDGQLFGTSYLTSSVELRHDFGLNGSFAQGLYGVLWGDYGGVWDAQQNFTGTYGAGAGIQLNLGFGGTRLPSLRFDYGFSPLNPSSSGRFMFRIGNFW